MRRQPPVEYSARSLSWAAQLVRAHADNDSEVLRAQVSAILEELGEDESALSDLIASLAGLSGQAITALAKRVDANDRQPDPDPQRRIARLAEIRSAVLVECAEALRQSRPATLPFYPSTVRRTAEATSERRSGFDRRVGSDRRHRPSGNPSQKINLRLFGERRVAVVDRRSGVDRRLDGADSRG
jgi:hypothetical protein